MKRRLLTLTLCATASLALAAEAPLDLSPSAVATTAVTVTGSVTLSDCYQAALKRSQTVLLTVEAITQAEEHYKQAMGSVLPTVSVLGQLYAQATPLGASPSNQNQYHFNASQPLFQGLREYAALRQTKALIKASKQSSAWAAWQLYSDTAQAFNNVLAQDKNLADLQSELQLYADRISFLQGWLNIGRAQDTDVLSIQSAQAQIKAQIEAAKYQLAASREVLAFLTGLPTEQALRDDQSLPTDLQPLEAYMQALDQRPDLVAALANVQAAKEAIDVASGQHLPVVSAGADYYPYRYSPQTDVNWDAYINFSMPIFMGGVINSQTRAAESVERQAEATLEQARRQDTENLRMAYAKLTYDLSQERALVDAQDLAQKDYKAETRNFERGLVTNLNVLQAMVTYVTTVQATDTTHYIALGDLQSLLAQTGKAPGLPAPNEEK